MEKKKATSSDELCKDFPSEFRDYVEYTRNLGYTDKPDYAKLKNNFVYLVTEKNNEKFDYVYDWTTESDLQKRKNDKFSYGSYAGKNSLINNATNKLAEDAKAKSSTANKEYDEEENPDINKEINKINEQKPVINNTNNNNNDNNNNNLIVDGNEGVGDKVESKCCMM